MLPRKIPLSPSAPTMYLNLFFFSVGAKRHPPPTRLHLGVCTTHQLTDQSVTQLIDCYRRVGVHDVEEQMIKLTNFNRKWKNTILYKKLRHVKNWRFMNYLIFLVSCYDVTVYKILYSVQLIRVLCIKWESHVILDLYFYL